MAGNILARQHLGNSSRGSRGVCFDRYDVRVCVNAADKGDIQHPVQLEVILDLVCWRPARPRTRPDSHDPSAAIRHGEFFPIDRLIARGNGVEKRGASTVFGNEDERFDGARAGDVEKATFLIDDLADIVAKDALEDPVRVDQGVAAI